MKKNIICILLLSLLLQSCYSYKTIDLKNTELITGKKYKIKTENKIVKGRLRTLTDSSATFKNTFRTHIIQLSEIKKIKKKKFSVVKTALVPIEVIASIIALYVIHGLDIH